jgi:ribose transport system permease protein
VGGRQDLSGFFQLETGHFLGLPMPAWILFGVALLAWVLVHATTHGRYMLAIGFNEKGAKYSGINTEAYKILAYTLCAGLAGLFGLLFLMDVGTASPNTAGNFYELYAITGAVLGGCSLRGGEGTVIGMVLGTAVLPLLQNLVNFAGVPSDLEFSVIGLALLGGTLFDELLRRFNSSARAAG